MQGDVRYFLRERDILAPVYAADFGAMTWRLVASKIGVVDDVGGEMPDGGARFLSPDFAEVWPKTGSAEGHVVYTRARP